MTGTVHDRAIAEELRRISFNIWPDSGTDVRFHIRNQINARADELEAAAPPATIEDVADADKAPAMTVLARGIVTAVRYHAGWRVTGDHQGYDADELIDYYGAPWTVLRWGAGTDA